MQTTPAQHKREEHPGHDQLTAFADNSLSEQERTTMVAHIGQCVRCREFLALITPEADPPATVALRRKKCA